MTNLLWDRAYRTLYSTTAQKAQYASTIETAHANNITLTLLSLEFVCSTREPNASDLTCPWPVSRGALEPASRLKSNLDTTERTASTQISTHSNSGNRPPAGCYRTHPSNHGATPFCSLSLSPNSPRNPASESLLPLSPRAEALSLLQRTKRLSRFQQGRQYTTSEMNGQQFSSLFHLFFLAAIFPVLPVNLFTVTCSTLARQFSVASSSQRKSPTCLGP